MKHKEIQALAFKLMIENAKKPKKKGLLLIWQCKICKWVTLSDQMPHRMDFCKCKTHPTAVDHEVHYTRISGINYRFLMLLDLDTDTILRVGKNTCNQRKQQKTKKQKNHCKKHSLTQK